MRRFELVFSTPTFNLVYMLILSKTVSGIFIINPSDSWETIIVYWMNYISHKTASKPRVGIL